MKFRVALSTLSLVTAAALAVPALADEPTNLKVINKATKEKDLEKAMKDITKGLGVKCETCHVKGKPGADDSKQTKVSTRDFFGKTIGTDVVKDEAVRKAALDELVKVLELKALKDEALIWKGVAQLKK